MSEYTIAGLLERMPEAFVPERAAGVNATVQLHLSGPGGGDWVITIANQQCKTEAGTVPNPNLTFLASAQDCLDIFTGKLDGMKAFMLGKLQLRGDMSLAMKLVSYFNVNRSF